VVSFTIYAFVNQTLPSLVLLAGCADWGGLQVALLSNFIVRSWFGIERRARGLAQGVEQDGEPAAGVVPST
jgi:hypothetical protein